MCWEIDRDYVQFDEFEGYEKATEKFKKTLCLFEHQKILFIMQFYMVYKLSQNKEKKVDKNIIQQILGKGFFYRFEKNKRKSYNLTNLSVISKKSVTL